MEAFYLGGQIVHNTCLNYPQNKADIVHRFLRMVMRFILAGCYKTKKRQPAI